MKIRFIASAAFIAAYFLSTGRWCPPAFADVPTTLFDFDNTRGKYPIAGLTLSGSTLYGTTSLGGTHPYGTIFSIPVTGGTPTVLFNFDFNIGGEPIGNLTLSGSTLYGMTSIGGANSGGTIFSIPVTGGTLTTLFSFDGAHGAFFPHPPYNNNLINNGLTLGGSTLYGMTTVGGANNQGTIFSIPVTGGTPTTLFSFDGAMHGQQPYGSLTLVGSTLYGTTYNGGANGYGTIFSIPIAGGTPTTLFDFDYTHGANPGGNLTLSDSTLYGMTAYGGANLHGTIFSIPIAGGTLTTLVDFDYLQGEWPFRNSLTLGGSTLYGMTYYGGANGEGVVFSLAVPEPSTFALAAIGAVALLAARRRFS